VQFWVICELLNNMVTNGNADKKWTYVYDKSRLTCKMGCLGEKRSACKIFRNKKLAAILRGFSGRFPTGELGRERRAITTGA